MTANAKLNAACLAAALAVTAVLAGGPQDAHAQAASPPAQNTATANAAGPDLAAGERSFRKCSPCHAIGPGARNKVGPELNGLDGRVSGTAAGYSYSNANKTAAIHWGADTFKEYIRNPAAKVPGTKMAFAGIRSQREIDSLWAYLAQFKADGSKEGSGTDAPKP